jgi:hypothetical protein
VQEALDDSRWRETMNEEMKALQKNSTWEVVDLLKGKIHVGCRWVFTIKYKAVELLNCAKQDLSPRDILKYMELIIWRLFHQWPKLILFVFYYL